VFGPESVSAEGTPERRGIWKRASQKNVPTRAAVCQAGADSKYGSAYSESDKTEICLRMRTLTLLRQIAGAAPGRLSKYDGTANE
jgi:hypothetical protein